MKTFIVTVLLGVLAVPTGCTNTVDEVDNAVDCNDVCNRYKTCFDKTYDVDACASACRSKSNEVKDFQRKVDACDSCLDTKACVEKDACATECSGIIPG